MDSADDILLGHTKNGAPVRIDPKTRRTHVHIIGSSGEGKSKFMEHLIRQDIIAGNGLCLIDPHGYLYNDLARWCESKGMLDRSRPKKIILFDPGADGWTFGFNPLQTGGTEISFHVDAMVKAVAKVWGGEDSDKTPLLKRMLRILFHALSEKNLSLYEAQHLLNPQNAIVRKYLTADIQDSAIRQQWDYLNELKPRQFYEEAGSTINRMMEFLASPLIRASVGQIENTIDFRKIMDEGWVLLVNLASKDKISDDNARLLGTLIVNDLLMKAKGRPEKVGKEHPFYLYVDECARYVNEDFARILDECRKFGLHAVFAHQHLAQLQKAGEDVYKAIMTDAKTKVVFGGLSAEDARILAEQIFLGELDLEETKESLKKPVVTGYIRTWLKSYSRSEGSAEGTSTGSAHGGGYGFGHSDGQVMTPDGLLGGEPLSTSLGQSHMSSRSWADSHASSSAYSTSSSEGEHEALMPILEERADQTFSLEEQIYKSMALMVNQPTQHAIIKLPKKKTAFVKTPTIEPGHARDSRLEEFKERCFQLSNFAHPRARIEAEIKARQKKLFTLAKPSPGEEPTTPEEWEEPPPPETDDFWE